LLVYINLSFFLSVYCKIVFLFFFSFELCSLGYESRAALAAKLANIARGKAFTGIAKAVSTRLQTYGQVDLVADKTAQVFLERASRGETPWSVSPH
jgi:hypothetical protein